jgi:hypothetical protein
LGYREGGRDRREVDQLNLSCRIGTLVRPSCRMFPIRAGQLQRGREKQQVHHSTD